MCRAKKRVSSIDGMTPVEGQDRALNAAENSLPRQNRPYRSSSESSIRLFEDAHVTPRHQACFSSLLLSSESIRRGVSLLIWMLHTLHRMVISLNQVEEVVLSLFLVSALNFFLRTLVTDRPCQRLKTDVFILNLKEGILQVSNNFVHRVVATNGMSLFSGDCEQLK